MRNITITFEFEVANDVIRARQQCLGAGGDRFDARSHHVVARENQSLIGAIRITPQSAGLMNDWAADAFSAAADHSKGCDLSRGFVVPAGRGLGAYRMLMLTTMIDTHNRGIESARSAIERGFVHRDFLLKIGFTELDTEIVFRDQPRSTLAVPIVCQYASHADKWTPLLADTLEELRTRNVHYVIECGA